MPSVVQNGEPESHIVGGNPAARTRLSKHLTYSGKLDQFKHHDLTPVIGREFEGLQVTDLLKWGDDMIRDLAITGLCAPQGLSAQETLVSWVTVLSLFTANHLTIYMKSPNAVLSSSVTRMLRRRR